MPTSNIPLTYAVNVSGTVHLYIVIYSGTQISFPASSGSDRRFRVAIPGTLSAGTTKNYKNYSFDEDDFDEIEITCNGHTRILVVSDIESDSLPSTQESGKKALEVPYCYTQKAGDFDHFKAEMVIFAASPVTFDCSHSGPDSATDTLSEITTGGLLGSVEFSNSNTFNVADYPNTYGAHQVVYSSGGGKKSKTRNRYHSPAPFPIKKMTKKPK